MVLCKRCKHELRWVAFGSMGSSHSNIYKCPLCGGYADIYDRDLDQKYYKTDIPKRPVGNPNLQEKGYINYKKYPVYSEVWHKYPHDICLEVLEKECAECYCGHERGFCIHQEECTKEYMKEKGWLL